MPVFVPAPAKAALGLGTVLSIGVPPTTGEIWTNIIQVKSFQFKEPTWAYDDVTTMDQGDNLKRSLPTLIEPGELSATGIYLPSDAGQTALATAFTAGMQMDFKLQLAKDVAAAQIVAGNLFSFSGFVQGQPLPDLSAEKATTFKVTIKINTFIIVTPGS